MPTSSGPLAGWLVSFAAMAALLFAQALPIPDRRLWSICKSLQTQLTSQETDWTSKSRPFPSTPKTARSRLGHPGHHSGRDPGGQGPSNIPEALRLAGNLNVASKTLMTGTSRPRIHTTWPTNFLFLIDDGRFITPLFSGVFWDVADYFAR